MKYRIFVALCSAIVALTSVLTFPAVVKAACAAGSGSGAAQELKGNWYCSQVKAITYSNFPGNGTYNKITNMDATTGQCESVEYTYHGSLSPLSEELSLHIRGPIWLKQVAFYSPSASYNVRQKGEEKRDIMHSHHGREHVYEFEHHGVHAHHGPLGHHHLHERFDAMQKSSKGKNFQDRAVGDLVTATIDGQVVSWTNEYARPSAVAPSAPSASLNSYPQPVHDPVEKLAEQASSSTNLKSASASIVSKVPVGNNKETKHRPGDWVRNAYYNAAEGTADGLIFLNHFGGVGGVPGTATGGAPFGTSLSYASSDGRSGAFRPQILGDRVVMDDTEVVIFSNKSCDDGDCGYTRPGGVAYHGFGGSHKAFLLEFTMPMTGSTAFNGDMPAVWLHNAQIPLTSQYGTNPNCSCWTTGCGEFDLFEILDSGDTKCKSTLHMAPAGGSSDWFMRPTSDSMFAAVIFDGDNELIIIRILDTKGLFPSTLTQDTVHKWASGPSSVFMLVA